MANEKKITCLLVDDEPPALEILKKYVAAVAALEFSGTCNNAVEALNILQTRNIDLLFLDIQMPQLLGTDLIRTLKKPPRVIFTTAHRKFAIEGYELDAIDYLLKPISFERFLKAVNKVLDNLPPPGPPPPDGAQSAAAGSPNAASFQRVEPSRSLDPFLHLRAERKTIQVALDDILYVESIRDYVKVVTRNRTIVSKQSISSLEEFLPREAFIRIHRSYIVSLSKIESYTHDLVEIGRQQLPISRMYRLDVEKILQRRPG
ncbi:LytR/AlgR family response regulator transcription factor [Puia dinghuensis]|uniref:DNA-binding response regulator n=1 Tax=Puia dinghuensis TaxID=1792502 RepID=A0A8J2XXV0_9BACT|nr:LytTR family DNA-binding domain-containing protein [Puia dinghuensis]GGB25216.1 DNA-binding response regulator [Puia dinghuensis]